MYVVGVNPVLHVDHVPASFPDRDRLLPPAFVEKRGPWIEPGSSLIVAPNGDLLAGPVSESEQTLVVDLDLSTPLTKRQRMDPTGHYNRPDVFRLLVDTSRREPSAEVSELLT